MLSSWFWVLRPQVLSLFLLAVLLLLLVRERYRIIPVLFVLWANAHGGVVLGGLVLGVAWAAAVLRWWRVRRAAAVDDAADRARARAVDRRAARGPRVRGGAARVRHLPFRHRVDGPLDRRRDHRVDAGAAQDFFGVVFWIVTARPSRRWSFAAGSAFVPGRRALG